MSDASPVRERALSLLGWAWWAAVAGAVVTPTVRWNRRRRDQRLLLPPALSRRL